MSPLPGCEAPQNGLAVRCRRLGLDGGLGPRCRLGGLWLFDCRSRRYLCRSGGQAAGARADL